MIRLLATITLAVNLVASSASAFDPAHLKRLKDTGDCIKCDLRGAYLNGTDLSGAYLRGADLRGAYLSGANLDGANLEGAKLSGANLDGAKLDYAIMDGAIFCNTTMPDGSVLYTGC